MNVSIVVLIVVLFAPSKIFAEQKPGYESLVTLRKGTLPIILSAPHGGRQAIANIGERRGVGVAQFSTGRDHHTHELTERIAKELAAMLGATPFSVVAEFERKYVDVNRPSERAYESSAAQPYYDAYHRALAAACLRVRERWGRGVLLDIHGQGSALETIYRGTYNGRTVSSLVHRFGTEAITGPRSIFGYLEQKGYRVSPGGNSLGRETQYIGGFIVQTYGTHRGTGIDAIQMEFGGSLRNRQSLGRMAADVAEAIAIFANEYLPKMKTRVEWRPSSAP